MLLLTATGNIRQSTEFEMVAAVPGRGRAVLAEGEPGIAKSALVRRR